MTILVHHLNYSRSTRALWLLHELGLPFEIKRWERDENFRAPAQARAVHPLGRFPIVEVDGRVLAESGAILEYFADREGKLRPTDPDALVEYRFFLHYAEGSAMPPLLVSLITSSVRNAPLPFFIRPIAKKVASSIDQKFTSGALKTHFEFIEGALAEREYFAGDAFSAADIQMIYPVEACLERVKGSWPNMRAWHDRVASRAAYKKAIEQGGAALQPKPSV